MLLLLQLKKILVIFFNYFNIKSTQSFLLLASHWFCSVKKIATLRENCDVKYVNKISSSIAKELRKRIFLVSTIFRSSRHDIFANVSFTINKLQLIRYQMSQILTSIWRSLRQPYAAHVYAIAAIWKSTWGFSPFSMLSMHPHEMHVM